MLFNEDPLENEIFSQGAFLNKESNRIEITMMGVSAWGGREVYLHAG